MGSHENLRQFKITLDFTQGVTKVVFRQKENLDEIDAMATQRGNDETSVGDRALC